MHPRSGPVPAFRRCWTLVAADGTVDVEVTASDEERLGAVRTELGALLRRPSAGLWSGSMRLGDEVPLSHPALAHGAVLGLGRAAPRSGGGPSRALELHVVGGPAAGTTLPLDRGEHVLGRGDGAGIPLDDPEVSRRHALVEVGSGEVTVTDLGSANGSRLDGDQLDGGPRPWSTGAVLRLGATAVRITGPGSVRARLQAGPGGRVLLAPQPRMDTPRQDAEIPFPAAPDTPRGRRLPWVAIALPALGGVVLAWVLDAPTFLFFALLSPVVAVGTWASDRWESRRSARRAGGAHAAERADAELATARAVQADLRAAETAHPDLAALTTAARRRSTDLWQRRATSPDALAVRVGTGPGASRVTRLRADGSRDREPVEHLPAVVELGATGGLGVVGPRSPAVGVLAGVLGQLAALHPPGDLGLALLTSPDRLRDWAWCRWLPHLDESSVHVAASVSADGPAGGWAAWLGAVISRRAPGQDAVERTGRGTDSGRVVPGWTVVVVDRPGDPHLQAALRQLRDGGVVVLTTGTSVLRLPVAVGALLELTGTTGNRAVLATGTADRPIVTVDRLPPTVAAGLARDLAALAPAVGGTALPRRVRLLDLPAAGLRIGGDGTATGTWPRTRSSLVAVLGSSGRGVASVDLCRQGPHLLVAGTTGSGKSELLQTLVCGLALSHPPDRCSFLLVDYKGGAAFAEAAALPHTVGLLTDLDAATTARALRSLTAELTRREELLAAHGVPDLAALPESVDLARLVIVVDEFAGLAEELPGFVSGLVGIAQRGRSLGVHLVLATQRPGGVVSPEIRANCTLRICLRTTDEADSRDVLGTPQAALLPIEVPGRAFVRVGGDAPVLCQVARVAAGPLQQPRRGPQVRLWRWPSTGLPGGEEPVAAGSDLARIATALTQRARDDGIPHPHRPWRPALPDVVHAEDLPAGAPSDLRIGLVDRPDVQRQEPLTLDLGRGGGWLAIGGARSGRTTFLRTVLAEAVDALSAEDLHVHVLDHGGGALAAAAAELPHTGTAVGSKDPLRTARLVDRLAQEVAGRRADPDGGRRPPLLLLVDGVDAVSTQLDEADPGRGSAALLRLVRDGAAAGLTCLLTADRAVPGGRLAAAAVTRLVLPLPDRADYAVAGLPARLVPEHRPPGRALVGEDGRECQLALPRPLPTGLPAPFPGHPRPLAIPELPAEAVLPLPRAARAEPTLRVPLGPGGDEGGVLEVDLARHGGLLVAGPPGSGRSTALQALGRHLGATGVPVLSVVVRGGAPSPGPDHAVAPVRVGAADVPGWRRWVAGLAGAPGAVVVDDYGGLADSPVLADINAPDGVDGLVFLVAGAAAELTGAYRGPVPALRRRRSGLLLCPAPGDADLLGMRLPRTPVPRRPGSGWLVTGGEPQRVQVARRTAPEATMGSGPRRAPP